MDIVLATRNRDKIKEIEAIMAPIEVTLVRLDDFPAVPEVVEDGATLEENALKKARVVREHTGCCALADDTGLEVAALGGAPGVYSSRYAGENVTYDDNNTKLLRELEGVPSAKRTARFRCVMALALVNDVAEMLYTRVKESAESNMARIEAGGVDALVTEGILDGSIAPDKRGTHGFGFDPLFEVPGLKKTLAELEPAKKNRISHRYRALVEMRELLVRWRLATKR